MGKILIGVATAALWFVLAHAANAARVCREVCDSGSCVSQCAEHPDTTVIRTHEHYRDDDGVGVRASGVGVEIGR